MSQLLLRVVVIIASLVLITFSSQGQNQTQCKATISAQSALTFCAGQSVKLTVNQNGHAYTWYKDGNEISGQKGEFITVTETGEYTVRIDNHPTCKPETTLSAKTKVTVADYPVADFTLPSGEQCAGNAIKFTNASTGDNLTYKWDFGDPESGDKNASTAASPTHVYKGFIGNTKKFKVKLTVTNSTGCERMVEKEVVIKEGPDATLIDVDAGAYDTPFVRCASNPTDVNYTVNVENKSTTGNINQTYSINWGDGSATENFPKSFTTASHTFTKRGAFKIVYTVTSSTGCTSTTTYDAYNGSNPSLSVGSPGNTVGCAPVTYTFPISGVADNSPATRYVFQFDDGSAPYIFTQENIPTSLTHTFTKGSCGNTSANAFTLVATAENPCGTTPITVGSIKIASPPVVGFTMPLEVICTNQATILSNTTVNGSYFTNSGTCNNSSDYSWSVSPATGWNFTSSTSGTSKDPELTFTMPGTYQVTLSSSNGCGSVTETKSIRVVTPPTAAFTLSSEDGCKDLSVSTTNTSTGDELKYLWSVSPATGYTLTSGTLTSVNPVFNFTEIGTYTVTLEASNDCNKNIVSKTITIRDKAVVSLPENQGYCNPLTIKFDSSNPQHTPTFTQNNGNISAYIWTVTGNATFVDGTTASSQYPAINFPDVGTYTVTLVATNECGDSAPATQTITIAPAVANTITDNQTICAGTVPAKLVGNVPAGGQTVAYVWEYSTTSATSGFQEISGATGSDYTPQALTETTWFRRKANAGGCDAISDAVKITVTPTPAAPTVAGKTICAGSIIDLKVENPNGTYEWFSDATSTTPVHVGANYETPVLQATTTYYVQTQGSQGCPSQRVPVTVTVDPVITANTITDDQAICTGEQPQDLIGSTPAGGTGTFTFLWEQSTDNQTFTAAAGVNTSKDYEPGVLVVETWYRRRVISGSCESVSDPVQIVVNGSITNNTISAPQTICTGTTPVALNGSIPAGGDGSYTYRWEVSTNGATGIFAPAPGENDKAGYVPGALTQTTWFRRVVVSNICSNPSTAVEITVNDNIGNNLLTGEQTICLGSIAILTGSVPTGGSGTYTYIWEVSTLSDQDGFVPAPGENDKQNYTTTSLNQTSWFRRRVTSAPCAVQYSTPVKITVNAAISQNTISGEQSVCSGSAPLAFSGSTPVGGSGVYVYLWESSTTGPNADFSPAAGVNNGETYQAGALTETTWFRRSVLSDPCTALASNSIKVTVFPVVADNVLSGAQTICTGSTPSALTGSTPTGGNGTYTYVWESSTDGATFAEASANNKLASYQPSALTQTTWFRRVVTSGGCSQISDPIIVTVNEEISANTITQDQLICVGATPSELFGSDPQGGDGNYTYLWESSTTGENTGFAPAEGTNTGINYAPTAITQTTWFRRVVSAGPCDASYSFAVKITVTPPIANNNISMPQAICEGTTAAALRGTTPTGGNGTYTYVWESSTTGPNGGFSPAVGVNDQLNYAPGQVPVTSWFRRIIYSEGCTSVSATVQITVVQPIANNNISSEQLVCMDTMPATLQGTTPIGGDGNYTYRWEISRDNVSYSLAPGVSNEANYTPRPLNANTWFRRVVVAGPCAESVSASVKIAVNAPVANNTIGSQQLICAGTKPGILHGSAPTGGSGTYSYLWEFSTTSAITGFSPAPGTNNTATYEPDVLQRTTWFRRKVVSLPCQESISYAVLVTVQPQPAAPQARSVSICPGTTATLSATALAATDRLEWFDQEVGGVPLQSGPSYTTEPLLATTDFYVQTVNQYGCASERTRVTVTVIEPQADAGPDITIIKGRPAQLRARGGQTYAWAPADGLTELNIADPVAKPTETTTYKVTITTAEGCVITDEVIVTVLPAVLVTNALTLNGDGLNETWFIENIEHYPDCNVQVFTRWGAKVFESVGYKVPWDGTHQGKQLPMAAYYYVIKLTKTEDPITGSITIIK
ncbi:gliding motility-associated C-terminal domain-containing protein [Pontibacter harenae]|uniref:gliding motility-associated C-terminal domain-containing protein n=1 Tax=Pontibacter harenae TaxID=2894083 RepID=UPI001E46478F|nr:PKD domain-containing protein [Pontibacter harenae]MCC9166274.1 PKD domain-containing protein [Pontibacter harenae]